jgi:hypothetical protein
VSAGVAFEVPNIQIPDDTPPLIPAIEAGDKDSSPLRCQKPGCSNSVTKPARGRTPKFCDEHKGSTPGTGNKSGLSGKSWPRATEIETLLTNYVIGLAFTVGFANAEDGRIIAEKAPAVIHELVVLAIDDRNLRKYLEWLATPGKYAPLTMACFSLILPILQNHGVVDRVMESLLGTVKEE